MLYINHKTVIPAEELIFEAVRSSGPGGQNVNKVNTCVRLSIDIINSPSLTEFQKHRIRSKLHNRMNKAGFLSVTSQDERSQLANKQIALQRLRELIQDALKPKKARKPTQVSRAKVLERKEKKQQHKQKKSTRGNLRNFDER